MAGVTIQELDCALSSMYEAVLGFLLVSFSVCGGYHMHAGLGT